MKKNMNTKKRQKKVTEVSSIRTHKKRVSAARVRGGVKNGRRRSSRFSFLASILVPVTGWRVFRKWSIMLKGTNDQANVFRVPSLANLTFCFQPTSYESIFKGHLKNEVTNAHVSTQSVQRFIFLFIFIYFNYI